MIFPPVKVDLLDFKQRKKISLIFTHSSFSCVSFKINEVKILVMEGMCLQNGISWGWTWFHGLQAKQHNKNSNFGHNNKYYQET